MRIGADMGGLLLEHLRMQSAQLGKLAGLLAPNRLSKLRLEQFRARFTPDCADSTAVSNASIKCYVTNAPYTPA